MQVIMDIEEYERLKKYKEELKQIYSYVQRNYVDIQKCIKSDFATIRARELLLHTCVVSELESENIPQEITIRLKE